MQYKYIFFILIDLNIIQSYIIIPLHSTSDIYLSQISNEIITINDKEIINKIFSKYINNVLYTDLIIGEPNQKGTAFLSLENFGFSFYEEFSIKELKELGYLNYNSYFKNKSKTIKPTNELNYDFSFWSYLSFEDFLFLKKYEENEIFSSENFENKELSKTHREIHFTYGIRNSSKIPNETDFINLEKKFQKEKEALRKLNFSCFSYFSLGFNFVGKYNSHQTKSFFDEFYSKKEITQKDWSFYYTKNKNNNYNTFLIMGSMPHIYLSNIFDKKEQFSTYGERYDWNNYPTLSFYDIYIKQNNEIISLNKYDRSAVFNFNFDLIRANRYIKTILEEKFFSNFIKSEKCFEGRVNKTEYSYFAYYYCDKNKIAKEEINDFPTIYLENKELSFNFELNSYDLFETFGDIIIFKIVFDTSSTSLILGKIFLKKYMFSFNEENRKIYFYNKLYADDEDDVANNNGNNNKYLVFKIIIIILAIAIFSILGFFLGKLIYKKRKNADELDDIENENFFSEDNKTENKIYE